MEYVFLQPVRIKMLRHMQNISSMILLATILVSKLTSKSKVPCVMSPPLKICKLKCGLTGQELRCKLCCVISYPKKNLPLFIIIHSLIFIIIVGTSLFSTFIYTNEEIIGDTRVKDKDNSNISHIQIRYVINCLFSKIV